MGYGLWWLLSWQRRYQPSLFGQAGVSHAAWRPRRLACRISWETRFPDHTDWNDARRHARAIYGETWRPDGWWHDGRHDGRLEARIGSRSDALWHEARHANGRQKARLVASCWVTSD